jgi:hypothetical protein
MALAGFVNLTLWLGWLRSSETFGLHWRDLVITEPIGCGALSYTLLPETKSSRTECADLIVAYETLSGYQIGKWFHRARISSGINVPWFDNNAPMFCHPDHLSLSFVAHPAAGWRLLSAPLHGRLGKQPWSQNVVASLLPTRWPFSRIPRRCLWASSL